MILKSVIHAFASQREDDPKREYIAKPRWKRALEERRAGLFSRTMKALFVRLAEACFVSDVASSLCAEFEHHPPQSHSQIEIIKFKLV